MKQKITDGLKVAMLVVFAAFSGIFLYFAVTTSDIIFEEKYEERKYLIDLVCEEMSAVSFEKSYTEAVSNAISIIDENLNSAAV